VADSEPGLLTSEYFRVFPWPMMFD
jgi:hypothetical protein